MITTFDHIGIAVRDLDKVCQIFQDVFGAQLVLRRPSPELGALSAAFIWGDKEVAFNQPVDENGPIGKFIARRGEGLEHLAVEVDDVEAIVAKLEAHGIRVINKDFESDVRREASVHPKHFFGLLLQMVEWRGECKHSMEARMEASKTLVLPVGN